MENGIASDWRYRKALRKYGTPLYIYDRRILRERVELLRRSLPEGAELCYAVKANTFIIKELDDLVEAFEICSPGEATICFRLGISPSKMVISGVYKTPEFIEELVKSGGSIRAFTVESEEQYGLLKGLAKKYGKVLPLLFRLTGGNQFGVDGEVLEGLLEEAVSLPELFTIAGVQFFSGTQKTSAKKLQRELGRVDGFLKDLKEKKGIDIRDLEFGPGIPAMYFEEDSFDEAAYFAEFRGILGQMESDVKLTFEIGRGIAASCGTYFTKIVDTKTNKGERYAIADGGMNHLVYYGQTMAIRVPRHEFIPPRQEGAAEERWNLCGALCSINDIIVKQLNAPGLKTGDVIAFKNAGAYCATEGMSLFLSRDLPAVVILREDGRSILVRRRFETALLNTPNYSL